MGQYASITHPASITPPPTIYASNILNSLLIILISVFLNSNSDFFLGQIPQSSPGVFTSSLLASSSTQSVLSITLPPHNSSPSPIPPAPTASIPE